MKILVGLGVLALVVCTLIIRGMIKGEHKEKLHPYWYDNDA